MAPLERGALLLAHIIRQCWPKHGFPSKGIKMSFNVDKKVSKSHLSASGWGMDDFYQASPSDSHFVYVCDYRNNQIKLFSILKSDLQDTTHHTLIPSGVLAGCVAELILEVAGKPLSHNDYSKLAAALLGYIKSTQTYRIWSQKSEPDSRMHCLLNIYPAQGGGEYLRPVMLKSKSTIVDAEQVINQSSEVRKIDMKNHPEQFTERRERRA